MVAWIISLSDLSSLFANIQYRKGEVVSTFTRTQHAIVRMTQRGIRLDDLELAGLIGTEVEGGCLVRRKDVQAFQRELKKLADQAQRLDGKRFVWSTNAVVTAYHASRDKARRLLRSAERSAFCL